MAKDFDPLSPEASPGEVVTGVRRLNRLPIFIIVGIVVAFAGTLFVLTFQKGQEQQQVKVGSNDDSNGVKKPTDSSKVAAAIVAGQPSGVIRSSKPSTPGLPLTASGVQAAPATASAVGVPIAPVPNRDAPPPPPRGNTAAAGAESDARLIAQIEENRFRSLETANRAKSKVAVDGPTIGASGGQAVTPGGPTSRDDMLARIADARQKAMQAGGQATSVQTMYQEQLARVKAGMGGAPSLIGGGGSGSPSLLSSSGASDNRNGYSQFSASGQGDRWKLDSDVQAPRSRFEIRTGDVIPGVMISGINSDLPGQIMGQVSQNVYDTATGKHLLIPQGTRLVGTYNNNVVFGQSAVLIAWQRLVFPDGKALDIGSMPGADGSGYSGFRDQVNNHYLRIYSSALLMSAITAGVAYSQDRNSTNGTGYQQPTASSELSQALGQQLGQVSGQLISKNLNIAPTLEIRPGYRFNIVVVKDLDFSKAYQSFDY